VLTKLQRQGQDFKIAAIQAQNRMEHNADHGWWLCVFEATAI